MALKTVFTFVTTENNNTNWWWTGQYLGLRGFIIGLKLSGKTRLGGR